MKLPKLFRRRSVILPTLPGMLLIIVLSALLIYLLLLNAASFLAVNEPIDGDYLVIEGWMNKRELNQAYRLFASHDYRLAIVSGGPITDEFETRWTSYAERARDYLLSTGFPAEKLVAVAAPYSAQDRTFLSAVMVRDWLFDNRTDIKSLDIVSAHVHTRRSRAMYRLAFGDGVEVGAYAVEPDEFELNRWWHSSDAAKSVANELIGLAVVKCCFRTGERGSHFEKWGMEKKLTDG